MRSLQTARLYVYFLTLRQHSINNTAIVRFLSHARSSAQECAEMSLCLAFLRRYETSHPWDCSRQKDVLACSRTVLVRGHAHQNTRYKSVWGQLRGKRSLSLARVRQAKIKQNKKKRSCNPDFSFFLSVPQVYYIGAPTAVRVIHIHIPVYFCFPATTTISKRGFCSSIFLKSIELY